MGWEAADMVMEIEDEFSISIPDEAAERIRTVGALIDYVQRMVGRKAGPVCLSAKHFYRVRRSLIGCFQADRRSIRPATRLSELGEFVSLQNAWPRMSRTLGVRLPTLLNRRRTRLIQVVAFSAFALLFLGSFALIPLAGPFAIVVATLAAIVLVFGLALGQHGSEQIWSTSTVGELVHWICDDEFNSAGAAMYAEDVTRKVKLIVADYAAIEPSMLKANMSFARDLGMD